MTLEQAIAEQLLKRYDAQYVLEFVFDEFGKDKVPPTGQRAIPRVIKYVANWSELGVDDDGLFGAVIGAVRKTVDKQKVHDLLVRGYESLYPRVYKKALALWNRDFNTDELVL